MKTVQPPLNVQVRAHISSLNQYNELYNESLEHSKEFWLKVARKFYWKRAPSIEKCLSYNFDVSSGPIFVKWFEDGVTNICFNVLDANIQKGLSDKVAFHWEGNDSSDRMSITFTELLTDVKKLGHSLKRLGVSKGDCVAIYMPMILEIVIAMLACARIGAVHSVIFGGFSPPAVASRIIDANCKLLITCDGSWRGSKLVNLKTNAFAALRICEREGHTVTHCIVVQHVSSTPRSRKVPLNGSVNSPCQPGIRPALNVDLTLQEGRDVWWHDLMSEVPDNIDCPVEWMSSEDPLFILYTSGSTGKPKGVVHTVGGYMVYSATTFLYTFDFHPDDVYWCTADAGWITGHSYVVYGPLLNGATSVMFEGIPTWPDYGRCWEIVDRYLVTKFYTAPTAIRTLMAAGDDYVTKYHRTSLQILGSVGEPINPTAWEWYYNIVGNGRCSIVDTFWQTETGGHMITPMPGATTMKPGCATKPFFGVDARIMSEQGADLTKDSRLQRKSVEGYLVFARPWPGMMRTIHGDHKRFENVYFSRFPGFYMAGDGAKMDEDGDLWITGRIDDLLNVSGHLVSTAEVEGAILLHPHVAEAAVVGRIHPVKGECLHCFITLKQDNSGNHDTANCQGSAPDPHTLNSTLYNELCLLIRKNIGPFVVPDHIQVASVLPKTRSGKILRRILRKLVNTDFDFGDLSTLADPSCLDELIAQTRKT